MIDFRFIYEIDNYELHLRDKLKEHKDLLDLFDILEKHSGAQAFIEASRLFLKTEIKFIEKPFNELKKVYVFQNRNKIGVKQLARKIGVDERTIYSWLAEFGMAKGHNKNTSLNTINMFEAEG